MPETNEHLEVRTALYQILKRALEATATIGSEQFVYWDPTTARKRLAPDAFVRLGTRHRPFRVWKTWERGAPDLAVEVVSDSDEAEPDWDEKLARYRAAGIREVVRFDARDPEQYVRVWDAVDGDLVERAPDDPRLLACEALGLWWTVVDDPAIGPMLRLARDREGHDLLPTHEESEARAREAADAAHKVADAAREAADGAHKAAAAATKVAAAATKAATAATKANKALEAEVAALRAELAKAKKTKPAKKSVARPSRRRAVSG